MNIIRYWPIIAGVIALVGTWTTFALQLDGIIKQDVYRLEQIRALENAKTEQAVMNAVIQTEHAAIDDYLGLLDSKYDKRCK